MSDEAIDMKELLERDQDDKELLMELLEIYLDDYPGKRKQLGEDVSAKNTEGIKSIAHSLKGAAGNISAKALHSLFWQIEQKTKNNDFSGVDSLISAIDQQHAILEQYIQSLKKK